MKKKIVLVFVLTQIVFSMVFVAQVAAWSDPVVISDNGNWWNGGESWNPVIAVDKNGVLHVVWQDDSVAPWSVGFPDTEIMYVSRAPGGSWSNMTLLSDNASFWNDGESNDPQIVVDNNGILHVVWSDLTNGTWQAGALDYEIMYVNYSVATNWSQPIVISDDHTGWNNGESYDPKMAVDSNNVLHVVWEDNTKGPWRIDIFDFEIMYANYSAATGWSNATVISDKNPWWNSDESQEPDIFAIGTTLHVVWEDDTDGPGRWEDDQEIMYVNYTSGAGWSNATVISDDNTDWNNATSEEPEIAVDSNGNVHVVWEENTDGAWGTDDEIMYTRWTPNPGWSTPIVISDDTTLWNNDSSKDPEIAVSGTMVVVAWEDTTNGAWGTDYEVMLKTWSPSQGWSKVTIISDGTDGWNNESSRDPSIAIEGNKVHVVWRDLTDGVWGTDMEVMYGSHEFGGMPLWILLLLILFPVIGLGLALFIIHRRRKSL